MNIDDAWSTDGRNLESVTWKVLLQALVVLKVEAEKDSMPAKP